MYELFEYRGVLIRGIKMSVSFCFRGCGSNGGAFFPLHFVEFVDDEVRGG